MSTDSTCYSRVCFKPSRFYYQKLEESFPIVLYRRFSEDAHRENFFNGNIWLAGVGGNRYYHPNEQMRDPGEYFYRDKGSSVSCLGVGATLSFFKNLPKNRSQNDFFLKIEKPLDFVNFICDQIFNEERAHKLKWFDQNDLSKRASKDHPVIETINFKSDEYRNQKVFIEMHGISAKSMEYGREKNISLDSSIQSSLFRVEQALKKDDKFIDEDEYRIEFHFTRIGKSHNDGHPCLYHLVDRIELGCNNIKEFCKKI